LVVNPQIRISTKWAYSKIIPKEPAFSLKNFKQEHFDELKCIVVNDFEKSIFNEYSEIKELKERLYKLGAMFALMTGSGSSVFGIFKYIDEKLIANSEIPSNYFIFVNK
jgi:4-diphosphocytidyl-2-C-methyl-D-erythritol kinase